MAHNVERNPLVKIAGTCDIVNNVSYNIMANAAILHDVWAKIYCNYEGNYHILGPNSDSSEEKTKNIQLLSQNEKGLPGYPFGYSLYLDGNIGPTRPTDDLDETLVVRVRPGVPSGWQSATRHNTPEVTKTSAEQAYNDVLSNAGNYQGLNCDGSWFHRRDSIDERVVNDVKNGTGRWIDNPSEVGGWITIASGSACADTDSDGMPDVWENSNGLNPNNSSDNIEDTDGDGYTNIEEYLNGTEAINVTAESIPPTPPTGLAIIR
jgi:hypothetical protein